MNIDYFQLLFDFKLDKQCLANFNKYVFNKNTVETVIQNLMQSGIKVNGDIIGKTIIFARNTKHANYIVECFDTLYPSTFQLPSKLEQIV